MILVLRALGVGDLAAAVPALRAVRAAFAGRALALAAPAYLAPLIELIGGIDRIVPADGLTPRRWPIVQPEVLFPYLKSWHVIGTCRQRGRMMVFDLDTVVAVTAAAGI